MNEYTFEQLNDKEFERLAIDLLSIKFDTLIQRYKDGIDGGIDGKFYADENETVIIQVKHYFKSGFSQLLNKLKKEEKPKVIKLNPKRYIVVTSVPLSPEYKNKIKDALEPYIINDSEIFGNAEINDLLSKNSVIEKKYYKLWISSTTVLQSILSNAINGRSKSRLEDALQDSRLYIKTKNHNSSLKILEKFHTVIISGEPGIGKTSLANALITEYVSNGYQLFEIENYVNEAEQVFIDSIENNDNESKQIFYFDDFLGRNYLNALELHQDSHIMNFISRIRKDKNKRFILTSRSNILESGKSLSDLFEHKNIEENEYKITISSLSRMDRARILYNHIWFSNLKQKYVEEFYKKNTYLDVIDHKNFNPRLIEFITDAYKVTQYEASNYKNFIIESLNNPKYIWENLFENQIDRISKDIVAGVVLHGSSITENQLNKFFNQLKIHDNYENIKPINIILRKLVGSLLNRNDNGNYITYNLFNPSIGDFVISEYFSDVYYFSKIFKHIETYGSLRSLKELVSNKYVSPDTKKALILEKYDLILKSNLDDEYYKLEIIFETLYSFKAVLQNYEVSYLNEYASYLLLNFEDNFFATDVCKLLTRLVDHEVLSSDDQRLIDFIETELSSSSLELEDTLVFYDLISSMDLMSNQPNILINDSFYQHRECVLELSQDLMQDEITSLLDDVYYIEEINKNMVEARFNEILREYEVNPEKIDFSNFDLSFDYSTVIEENRSQQNYNYRPTYNNSPKTNSDSNSKATNSFPTETSAIHDLFKKH